jgi:hypothetical protein
LLANGQVLVAGGGGNPIFEDVPTAEIYDPSTRVWTLVGSMSMARVAHSATLLPHGKVLVTGGQNSQTVLNSAELYNPATGTWTRTGPMTAPRLDLALTLLSNGKVLAVSGRSGLQSGLLATAELYESPQRIYRVRSP